MYKYLDDGKVQKELVETNTKRSGASNSMISQVNEKVVSDEKQRIQRRACENSRNQQQDKLLCLRKISIKKKLLAPLNPAEYEN